MMKICARGGAPCKLLQRASTLHRFPAVQSALRPKIPSIVFCKGLGPRIETRININIFPSLMHTPDARLWKFQRRQVGVQSSSGGGGGAGGKNGGSGGGGEGSGDSGGGGAAKTGIAGLWAAYLMALDSSPVIAKSLTSACLNGFGDIMSQLFIEKNPFDWKRLFKFTAIGLLLVGPTLHFWYLSLSRIVTLQGTAGAALRLALDQLAFAPTFIVAFFSTLCCFELNPAKIAPMLRQEWWPAVITNWQLWVPFQFLNFRLVPQNLQVLFANMVALVWNTYLSFASHRNLEDNPS